MALTDQEPEGETDEQLDMVAVQGEILAIQAKAGQAGGSSGPEDLAWVPVWYLRMHAGGDAAEKRIQV